MRATGEKVCNPSTTEYYFSLHSGGVSREDVGGELYRRPLRNPEVRHLSVDPYEGTVRISWLSIERFFRNPCCKSERTL
jgi:hypothetical protein